MTDLILTPWFSKQAPLRPPDWRWLRIRQLCATVPPCRSLPGEDEFLPRAKQAYVLVRATTNPPSSSPNSPSLPSRSDRSRMKALLARDPDLTAAVRFGLAAERPGTPEATTADVLRARVLAGQGAADIATVCGLTVGFVTWFERLLFDVRDRLDAFVWVWSHVLVPAFDRDAATAAARSAEADALFRGSILLFVAYQGGLALLESMPGVRRGSFGSSTTDVFRTILLEKAIRAVLTVEVTDRNLRGVLSAALRVADVVRDDRREEECRPNFAGLILGEIGRGPAPTTGPVLGPRPAAGMSRGPSP